MRTLDQWIEEYGRDHQNKSNRLIHRFCVPAILLSVVGLLHIFPLYVLNTAVGDILLGLVLSWYILLGWKAFALAAFQLFLSLAIVESLLQFFSLQSVAVFLGTLFTIAWIGQFYGHHLEGRRPSFLKDLQYLLIGPLWVVIGHTRRK